MNPIKKIWQSIRKGGAKIGMVESLRTITDHPKINVDPKEYERIKTAMKYYEGKLPDEEYISSKGNTCKRPFFDLPLTPLASDYLANLIVNESFDVTVGKENSPVNVFMQKTLADNDFKKKFGEYLSPMFAVGGLAVRPYVDDGEVRFNWALADSFFPLRNNTNNISEGVFISHSTNYVGKKAQHYTLFEFHEWIEGVYTITNELYKSDDPSNVGISVKLNELYDGIEPVSQYPNVTRPLFVYLKPAGYNNLSVRSPLGLGVADNCKKIIDQINETNNQMHYDMKKAKPRIVASEHYFNISGGENGVGPKIKFDDKSDEFLFVTGDEANIQDLTFKFDPAPYENKINYHLRWFEQKLKLQQGTFSFERSSGGVKTATQIVSEDSDTFRTRNMQISQIEPFISDLCISIWELMQHFKEFAESKDVEIGDKPEYKDISVDFDDGIFTNKQQESEFYSQGLVNSVLSKKEFMKRVYKMTDDEADEQLQAIVDEGKLFSPEHQEVMREVKMLGREE